MALRPRAQAIAVFLAAAVIAALWSLHAGKDLSWDLLHYHYYAAHAFVEGRLERDFFAASAQGYLNPVGFLPFYWMVSSGWHSVIVSALLAAIHAANVALLYAIAHRLFAHRAPGERLLLSLLAALLGAASAVFWATIGTSFLDPLLTVPMLGAVLLLIQEGDRVALRTWCAGILFGAAAAMKYSNAMFALSGIILVISQPGSPAARVRALAAYGVGGVVGVALFGGTTFIHLYREYGNPVFPLFNAWFRSPDFPPISIFAERFAPRGFADGLAFPLHVLSPESMVYVEISAPDVRFAALALLILIAIGRVLVQRFAASRRPATVDLRLLAFFLASYAAWLATSANGRYGLFVILLAGPLAARLADAVFPTAIARAALVVLLFVQFAVAVISPARWYMSDLWSPRWFPYDVPERAKTTPALYLTVETQAMGVIVPFLHPDSSFINLRGQHSVEASAKRVQALLEQHKGKVRAIGRALRLQRDGKPRAHVIDLYDSTLLRYGLRLDTSDCFSIAWRPERYDALSGIANLIVAGDAGVRGSLLSLASCALRPGSWSPAEIEAERRISALFDRIERQCPGVFRGQTSVTEKIGTEWSRSYAGLEASIETRNGNLVLVPFFKLRYHYLGQLSQWENGVPASLETACRDGLR